MTEMYRRRIRVEGKPDALNGFALTITDADTGEMIEHVYGVDLSLRAAELNKATIHYYEFDEHGKIMVKNGKPVEETIETDNPEASLTALETMSELEQLRAEVQMYRDANMARIQERREKDRERSVFAAFSVYADKIERQTHGREVLTLKVYSDGSGHIRDDRTGIIYMEFSDLEDVMKQLQSQDKS